MNYSKTPAKMFQILRMFTRLPGLLPKNTLINQSAAFFSVLAKPNATNINPITNQISVSNLLTPLMPSIVPSCGFKVKGRLKRRCKDCYFVMRNQRLYVICETHPRHKQMSMIPKEKNTWILTHATQGKVRAW